MLLNQLWAALEEKLENKSQLQESRNELDKLKGKKFISSISFFSFTSFSIKVAGATFPRVNRHTSRSTNTE